MTPFIQFISSLKSPLYLSEFNIDQDSYSALENTLQIKHKLYISTVDFNLMK